MRLEVFSVLHGRAGSAAELIRTFLPEESRIAADARTNKVVLLSTPWGIDLAADILSAIDEPAGTDPAPATPRTSGCRLYDYEVRRARYGGAIRDVGTARGRSLLPFQRAAGVLTQRDDESVTITREEPQGPLRLVLPKLRSGDGEWRASERLVGVVRGLDLGSPVVVEWWEAEGSAYLEGIAAPKARRPRAETSIFGDRLCDRRMDSVASRPACRPQRADRDRPLASRFRIGAWNGRLCYTVRWEQLW